MEILPRFATKEGVVAIGEIGYDEQGIPESDVRKACYENALAAYGQSGQMSEHDWLNPPAIDQRTLYEGNSSMRGGRDPDIAEQAGGRTMRELEIE